MVGAIIITTIIAREIMEMEVAVGTRTVGLFKVIIARIVEEQLMELIWNRYSCASFAMIKYKMRSCVPIAQSSVAVNALK